MNDLGLPNIDVIGALVHEYKISDLLRIVFDAVGRYDVGSVGCSVVEVFPLCDGGPE